MAPEEEDYCPKYEFTGETKQVQISKDHFVTVKRIRAIRDIDCNGSCNPGGWIEKEENLSHYGNCWVGDNAVVCQDAYIEDDAQIEGNAMIRDHARICDEVEVSGNCLVEGSAHLFNKCILFDKVIVKDMATVYGNAWISGNCRIEGTASISDNVRMEGSVIVKGNARIHGNAKIEGDAIIGYNAHVYGDADIRYGAKIDTEHDWLLVGPLGVDKQFITFYTTKDKDIMVAQRSFQGAMTLDQFIDWKKRTHGLDADALEYNAAINLFKRKRLSGNHKICGVIGDLYNEYEEVNGEEHYFKHTNQVFLSEEEELQKLINDIQKRSSGEQATCKVNEKMEEFIRQGKEYLELGRLYEYPI